MTPTPQPGSHISLAFQAGDGLKTLHLAGDPAWDVFVNFVTLGAWHILRGFDHLLFLAALLVTSVMVMAAGKWQPAPKLNQALGRTLVNVTLFAIVHTFALGLATLSGLRLPIVLVDAVLALAIVLLALGNMVPKLHIAYWKVIALFAIGHGVGYGPAEINGCTAEVLRYDQLDGVTPIGIGKACDEVDTLISEEGELLVAGDQLMQGYWNTPERNAATLNQTMGAQVCGHGAGQHGVTFAVGREAIREGAHRFQADANQRDDPFRVLVLDRASFTRLDAHVRDIRVQTELVRCRAGRLGREVAGVDHAQEDRARFRIQRHQGIPRQ